MPRITTITELETLYGFPQPPAIAKEIDYISEHYKAFIDRAPFIVMATAGPEGLDCSPRGDPAGFVRVCDPRIALLFLIPGIDNTLRINGRAEITTDEELCASFAMAGKLPKSVIVVHVERVYFQCPKALVRSRLWSPEVQVARSELPSTGTILESLSKGAIDANAYDRNYPQRLTETIY